ncbi:GNAT family N-acetyltransferase [Pseudoalteromonas denitrificans]|uniref:Protein N-acetyltransferase, RimJ/RimL family n=1 Tax=Pseudoalteromonas denitrificans DSM 6059 TaxID=1123010 RepID=A0A1I1MY66_9GAMM|nr:GNAT family protein [Pseudoalteromonas denitrificans]SFC89852.1 Protein N-acetyltransferase, RimJ/RimL family [Pseudoalteromonas denitrificans DSM 6059]
MTPKLNSKNYIIRAFKYSDLQTFADYRARPEVAQFQSWSSYVLEDAISLFENIDYKNFAVAGNWYQLAITDIQTDNILGDLAVYFIDDQQVEIGFTIAPEFQKQGIAFEAINCLLTYLFTELKIHRIIAITDANNTASYKLLEKIRFRKEAHFIQNVFFKGVWGDEFQYALLSTEFK